MRTLLLIILGGILIGTVLHAFEDNASNDVTADTDKVAPPESDLTAADFVWSAKFLPRQHQDQIVEIVNDIHHSRPACWEMDPSSTTLSERSTDGHPVFFVTCTAGPGVQNVWFDLEGRHWSN